VWCIHAMEGTPSPASDGVANGRCRCCGGGLVGAPLLPPPRWHGSVSHCDITRDNGVDSDNRQPATVYKASGAACGVSLWLRMTQWGLNQLQRESVIKSHWREWATRSELGTCRIAIVWLVATVWIVKSPSPVKSSSYELSCIECRAGLCQKT
jgi:hypothetical protein